MIRLSWLFASVGSFLLGTSVLQMFGWGLLGNALFFLPMLAGSLILAIVARLFRRGRMTLCVLFTAAQCVLVTVVCRQRGTSFAAVIPAILCAGFIPYHLLMLCQEPGEEYPPTVWYLGLMMHALCLFLLRAQYFAGAAAVFKLTALSYYVFVIFALNELALSHGMAGDKRPTRLMRLRNRTRAAALALGLVIACNLEGIRRAAEAVVGFFKAIIAAVLRWLMRDEPAEYMPKGEGGRMDLSALVDGAAETPLFWRILEKIMYAVAAVMFIVLCVLIAKKLGELLVRAAKFIWARLRGYAEQVSDAYEDTVESLFDWGEMQKTIFKRREKRVKPAPVDWAGLSPRESVRMRYKVLRDRVKDAPGHLTARQVILQKNVSPQAADLYDRARYSSAEVSAADAEKMKELVK